MENSTVQKTLLKSATVNTELMRDSEIDFHCTNNIRLLNTKNHHYESSHLSKNL
jgi:hypothetical protein